MRIVQLIYVLFKIKLLSPIGLYRLISAIFKYGINVMALLSFAARTYGERIALVDAHEIVSYEQLWSQSEKLAFVLQEKYQLKSGQRVGVLCKNHASLVRSIFAVSMIGADLYLLNAEMSSSQFNRLVDHYDFDFLVYDIELSSFIKQSNYSKNKILSDHDQIPAISNLLHTNADEKRKHRRTSSGKIVLLTGGTTGNFKVATHQPSIFNFLNPFITLITRLKLIIYKTAYIATPIYHGYGVAQLFVFLSLGKKIIIHNGFDSQKACSLIREHHVEVVTVVPLMIYKMLKHHPEDLKSLACIASGGAELNPKLVDEVFRTLGDVLFNLYGTSEAGLNIIATPQDLKYSNITIGKKINGVRLKIVDEQKHEVAIGEVGQFCIKNRWSKRNDNNLWIETGDLGYIDSKGYYYLCGRVDHMIVSAGENVYPIEVEQILIHHPQIEDVAVIGIRDEVFGQRLKAFVQLTNYATIRKEELFDWLRPRVARYQLPKEIVFVDQLPYTPLGKVDKKQLI